ncbi:MAG: zf-TFIIB domain-containing protein [Rhodobacterales bacterium]|nr:zf-TFIIB domain-containing protein [Rhodobacterales bacterium]
MQCPVDGTMLVMADRSGVEIDYCPKCRGVWLDRGELDKIIERAAVSAPPPAPAPAQKAVPRYGEEPQRDDYRREHDDDDYKYGRKKKRESFLGELFDF